MDEYEWLTSADHEKMLELLFGYASNRKLRLYGVACCRHIWNLLHEKKYRYAVECSERYADGQIDKEQLLAARREAEQVYLRQLFRRPNKHQEKELKILYAADAVRFAASATGRAAVLVERMHFAARYSASAEILASEATSSQPHLQRCNFLRDIIGNPFCPVIIEPTWIIPSVVALARSIYDERAFDRMPELAGALTEAGCDSEDTLDHCRQPGPHVRGCWAVDLVLGKE